MADDGLRFDGRVGLQQRVLPAYRIAFVERLASSCGGGLQVFAGESSPGEAILAGRRPRNAEWIPAHNRYLLSERTRLLRQAGLVPWLAEWGPDVVILEANPRNLSNWRAASWARQVGIGVIGWGLGAPGTASRIRRVVWRRYLRRFDALIAYSTRGADQLRLAAEAGTLIRVAVNAVVDPPVEMVQRDPPGDRPAHVLFVGRLQARKGVDRLLRACAGVDQPLKLRVVGDGPARSSLQALAAETLPSASFTGSLEGEALEHAFAWADLFVLPGTGGLAVQQAMAHGLPVIVAEGDGTQRDLVRDENGWLVRSGDLASLKDTLDRALSDPAGLMDKGRASYRIAEHEANVGQMVKTFVDVMRTVAGGGGR
jgi:glycosyltransferase involved in cell wall biosynthesis